MSEWTHAQLTAKDWTGQQFDIAHAKLDGWRVTFFRQPKRLSNKIVAYGKDREGTGVRRPDLEFFTRFPRLHDHPTVKRMLDMRPMTSIDCEIMTMEADRSSVITALKNPAIPLKIVAFAVPFDDGADMTDRPVSWAAEQCIERGIEFAPWESVRHFTGEEPFPKSKDDIAQFKRKLVARSTQLEHEGWMLKANGQYGEWYKVKPRHTVDCIIVGVIPGEGKYVGQLGSLVLAVKDGQQLVEIASASGMTDQQRAEMSRSWSCGRLVNRVAEIEYQLVGKKGRLIHPGFVRLRDDKPAHQCTIDQIRRK